MFNVRLMVQVRFVEAPNTGVKGARTLKSYVYSQDVSLRVPPVKGDFIRIGNFKLPISQVHHDIINDLAEVRFSLPISIQNIEKAETDLGPGWRISPGHVDPVVSWEY